jgi:hypothetical protein
MLTAMLLGQPVRLSPYLPRVRRAGPRVAAAAGSMYHAVSLDLLYMSCYPFPCTCSCSSGVNRWDGLDRLFRTGQASPRRL